MNRSINSIAAQWQQYLNTLSNWEQLINSIEPRQSSCGLIYELSNHFGETNESFAIADMQAIQITAPHYHIDETEIYIILQGSGIVVVGDKEHRVEKGSVVITPPNTAHFTLPKKNLVMAVINTPPFDPTRTVWVNQRPQVINLINQ